ncbi:hypothetical protein AWZ03_014862, partial [Drosophila navojoa]
LSISLRDNTIVPNSPAQNFDGKVSITLQTALEDVKEITLHKDVTLSVMQCVLYDAAGKQVEELNNSKLTSVEEAQQLTVPLKQALTANVTYTLFFKYVGKIQTDTVGLFSASYMDEAAMQTKWVLLTQMQPINARLVLPCFDEPTFKAKFQLSITRPKSLNAISNTKLKETKDEGNNRFTDLFEVTPIMSPYLLAFVVSEYQMRGNSTLSIHTRPAYNKYTEFSYSVAERVLPAYGELFQQPYQELGNDVLQYATTPRFPHNSMENWGLVIFKDKVLLEQPGVTDGWAQKEFTIRNIVHENAHMWFGNSVTCKWWSSIWLHEGFARYYEFFMGHKLYPEYQLDQQFVVHKLQHVLTTDSLNITQPMTSSDASIQTPADIAHKFGRISFAKAASVIRMWSLAMGEENFNRAIANYLKEFYLGNTNPSDLLKHIQANWPNQENISLGQFFYDFIVQVGYPLITVSLSVKGHQINFYQQRFLLNDTDGSDSELRYTVPITYTTNLAPNFTNSTPAFFFHKLVDIYQRWSDEPIDWVIVNLKQANYHRVQYEQPLLDNIQKALTKTGHSGIPVENRAAIIDDLFNFALAQMIDYVEVFEFMEYMSTETDYIPWYAAYVGLEKVARRLTPQQLPNFKKYLSDITEAVHAKLGVSWSASDKVLDVYNRNQQVSWLCKYQTSNCTAQVLEKFNGSEKPSPDYRETFYCAAARTDGYARVLELYKKETNYIDREIYWRAASCTRDYRTHYQNEILGQGNSVDLKMVGLAQLYEQNPDLVTPIFQMVTENISQLNDALGFNWTKTA